MPFIDWLESYNTGIDEIDKDNQQFVEMINLLHNSITKKNNQEIVNQTITQLAQRYKEHCAITISSLKKINYSQLPQQIESQKKIGKEIAVYLQRIKKGDKISIMSLISFLKNWFDNQILVEDKKIRNFVKKNITNQGAKKTIEPLVWDKSFDFSNEKIDKQHQQLTELYNKLHKAFTIKMDRTNILNILHTFQHNTEAHFHDEEQLMVESKYEHYDEHVKLHKQLIVDFDTLLDKVNSNKAMTDNEILKYLRNWLTEHLANEDKEFFDYYIKFKKIESHA